MTWRSLVISRIGINDRVDPEQDPKLKRRSHGEDFMINAINPNNFKFFFKLLLKIFFFVEISIWII